MHDPNNAATIPLTAMQKARLIRDCLPLLFFLLALVFVAVFLRNITGAPPPMLLILFLGLVVLFMGWVALNRMRDLMSGVALVQEDLLQRLSRGTGRQRHAYGEFEQLGRFTLTTKAFHQGQRDQRHRVTYSPASKIVWTLEPLP
jgi:hypothetical protein